MELTTNHKILIGLGAFAIVAGSFALYKYNTEWKFQDGDEKVQGGKVLSSFSKQNGWALNLAKVTGEDQSTIDKRNEKYAKSVDGVYRKGVKIA